MEKCLCFGESWAGQFEKGKNELQIESIALAPGHDTGFFGIDKLTLRK